MWIIIEWCILIILGLCTINDIAETTDYTSNIVCGLCLVAQTIAIRCHTRNINFLESLDLFGEASQDYSKSYNNLYSSNTNSNTHSKWTNGWYKKQEKEVIKEIYNSLTISHNIKNKSVLMSRSTLPTETMKVEGNTAKWENVENNLSPPFKKTVIYKAVVKSLMENTTEKVTKEIIPCIIDVIPRETTATVYYKDTVSKNPSIYLNWSVIRHRTSEILGNSEYVIHCLAKN